MVQEVWEEISCEGLCEMEIFSTYVWETLEWRSTAHIILLNIWPSLTTAQDDHPKFFISDHTILKWKQSTFFVAFLALYIRSLYVYIRSPYFRYSLVTMKVWGFLALRTECNPHGAPAARTSVQCMLSWSLHSRVFLPLKLSYANMFLRQINLLAIHA